MLRWPARWALSLALIAGCAIFAAWCVATLFPQRSEIPILAANMSDGGGQLRSASLPLARAARWLEYRSDTSLRPIGSHAGVLENGKVIGPGHSLHSDISEFGGGRFSHWNGSILFSSSDGSDPRANGRTYAVELVAQPTLLFTSVSWALFVLAIGANVWFHPGIRKRVVKCARSLIERHGVAIVIGIGAAAIILLKPLDFLLISSGDQQDLWRLGTIGVLIVASLGWKSSHLPGPFVWATRTFTLVLAAFAFLREFPLDHLVRLDGFVQVHHLIVAPVAVLIAGAFAWHWPMFGLYVAAVAMWRREEIERQYGVVLGHGEEKTMAVTLSMMLLIGSFVFLCRVVPRHRVETLGVLAPNKWREPYDGIVFLAVALQFSNYFYSSLQKWNLDGGPGDWLHNATYFLLPSADVLGASPVVNLGPARFDIFAIWSASGFAGNLVTLVTQASSIIVLWLKPLLAPAILFFDLWHVGVAVLAGIVFWVWITINVVLAVCVARIPSAPSLSMKLLMTAFLLAAPHAFPIFMAGWYDTPAVNKLRVFAVTDEGKKIPAPPLAFYLYSYTFTMANIFDRGETQKRFFPTSGYGTARTAAGRDEAFRCQPVSTQPEFPPFRKGVLRVMAAVHDRAAAGSGWRTLAYPHHLFAGDGLMSYLSTDFSRIAGYRFELDAVCIVPQPGGYRLEVRSSVDKFVPLTELHAAR